MRNLHKTINLVTVKPINHTALLGDSVLILLVRPVSSLGLFLLLNVLVLHTFFRDGLEVFTDTL